VPEHKSFFHFSPLKRFELFEIPDFPLVILSRLQGGKSPQVAAFARLGVYFFRVETVGSIPVFSDHKTLLQYLDLTLSSFMTPAYDPRHKFTPDFGGE
jgi:hypothetical protein